MTLRDKRTQPQWSPASVTTVPRRGCLALARGDGWHRCVIWGIQTSGEKNWRYIGMCTAGSVWGSFHPLWQHHTCHAASKVRFEHSLHRRNVPDILIQMGFTWAVPDHLPSPQHLVAMHYRTYYLSASERWGSLLVDVKYITINISSCTVKSCAWCFFFFCRALTATTPAPLPC